LDSAQTLEMTSISYAFRRDFHVSLDRTMNLLGNNELGWFELKKKSK